MTFFQAVVTELYPKIFGEKFRQKVSEFEEIWAKTTFDPMDLDFFQKQFKIGVQIWTEERDSSGHVLNRKILDTKFKKKVRLLIKEHSEFECIPLKMHLKYIYDDSEINFYSCSNKNCLFGTNRYDRLQSHIQVCRTETEVIYNQKIYNKPDNWIRMELQEEGYLPSLDFQNTFFATFDIESLMSPDTERLLSLHKLATIGFVKSFGQNRETFLYRRDMSPEALKFLISEFLDLLLRTQNEMKSLLPEPGFCSR